MVKKVSNILKWFTNVGNVLKTIATIISLAGAIYGGIKWYDARVIKKHEEQKRNEIIMEYQQTLIAGQDSIIRGQYAMRKDIQDIRAIVDGHTKQFNALNKSYTGVLKGMGKVDELVKYYESLQEETLKKNENYLLEIPLEQKPYWIPYSSELIQEK